jgi:hypothetical protein
MPPASSKLFHVNQCLFHAASPYALANKLGREFTWWSRKHFHAVRSVRWVSALSVMSFKRLVHALPPFKREKASYWGLG